MGSPQLKAKRDLNYRRKSQSRSCEDCNYYLAEFQETGIGGVRLGIHGRCELIGLNNGRAYRISPSGLCDKHDISRYMEKLLRGSSFQESSP